MAASRSKILVTAASGQLGRLVVEALLRSVPAADIVATARRREAIEDLGALGVETRVADYSRPETLEAAFTGVDRLLLISSNEIGRRTLQHQNAISAAATAGVGLIAYTSVLRADVSPLTVAVEHRETEAALRASGVPFVALRNGWYTENYTASIPPAIASGSFYGSAGDGRISSAARVDYADAAAAVLAGGADHAGRIYELAGDDSYALSDFAREIAAAAGKPVAYVDLAEDAYRAGLIKAGLPEPIAGIIASSDRAAADGALQDDGRELSALIGRPTTPWRETLRAAIGS